LNTGTHLYLITAKHVLFDNLNLRGNTATLKCPSRIISDPTITIYQVNLEALIQAGEIFQHPTKDIAGFIIGTINPNPAGVGYSINLLNGINLIQQGSTGVVSVSSTTGIKFINQVLISNDVYMYGYPSSLGIKQSPQFDYTRPLLRKGIIANLYIAQGTIILDCPVYYGNSGGPAVQVEFHGNHYSHHVIGVILQFIPYSENWINQSNNITHTEISNSGYSVALAMDYVFEMLGIPINNPAVN